MRDNALVPQHGLVVRPAEVFPEQLAVRDGQRIQPTVVTGDEHTILPRCRGEAHGTFSKEIPNHPARLAIDRIHLIVGGTAEDDGLPHDDRLKRKIKVHPLRRPPRGSGCVGTAINPPQFEPIGELLGGVPATGRVGTVGRPVGCAGVGWEAVNVSTSSREKRRAESFMRWVSWGTFRKSLIVLELGRDVVWKGTDRNVCATSGALGPKLCLGPQVPEAPLRRRGCDRRTPTSRSLRPRQRRVAKQSFAKVGSQAELGNQNRPVRAPSAVTIIDGRLRQSKLRDRIFVSLCLCENKTFPTIEETEPRCPSSCQEHRCNERTENSHEHDASGKDAWTSTMPCVPATFAKAAAPEGAHACACIAARARHDRRVRTSAPRLPSTSGSQ